MGFNHYVSDFFRASLISVSVGKYIFVNDGVTKSDILASTYDVTWGRGNLFHVMKY